jgi:hypothetical protein
LGPERGYSHHLKEESQSNRSFCKTVVKGQTHNPDQNDNEKKGKEANTASKEIDSTTTTGLSEQQPNSNKDNQAEEGKEADWFPSCVVQYSTVLYEKLFWVVSNLYLYNTYHIRKNDTSVSKYPLSPPNMRAFF